MNKFLFSVMLLASMVMSAAEVPRIILDTDVSGDYDDIGAMAVMFNLEAEGKCQVLGIASSSSYLYSIPLVEVIARSFGRGDLPMARSVPGARAAFNWEKVQFSKVVTSRFSHPRFAKADDAAEPVAFYKELLAAQPDHSVTLCVVGWASNLAALLKSEGGRDLVARKVEKLVWMAGREKGGKECNFMSDVEASKRILADFPCPIVFSMYEIGSRIFTGRRLVKELGSNDPVRLCYSTVFAQSAHAAKHGRESWDQTALWYAVHGDDELFRTVRGTCVATDDQGMNAWQDDPNGKHVRLEFVATPEEVAERIESYMVKRCTRSQSIAIRSQPSTSTSDLQSDPRPFVWWHWSGTAVTKEGIIRDLDAMLDAGIGGATIFQITFGPCCGESLADGYDDNVNPKLEFGNDAWCDMVAFAAREAKIRGLEIGMHNCPGYTVSGGPWIAPENAMKKLVWTSAPKGTVPGQPETKLGFYRDIGTVEVGDKAYRFGYTCTGSQCMPIAKTLWNRCLEADKMSAKAINLHLDNVLRRDLGLDFILMDSYEAGPYDWTDDFREEFTCRRGYDPLAYLPAYVGVVQEDAEKIKADMARTVEELSTERHYWVFRDRLHAKGLKFVVEPYGGPFDHCEAGFASDMPTTEFWGRRPFWVPEGVIGGHPMLGGAAGRAAGRTILAAEAFTAMPFDDSYTVAPKDLKAYADASFARGINRMLLHHWVHQPFPACRKPGMSMGYWGTHFGENQTWFEPGKAFFRYLRNCQEWLQRGEEVVDVVSVEISPSREENFDTIPRRVFLNGTELADGEIRIREGGRRYRYLKVRPDLMSIPEIAARVKACKEAGVIVLEGKSPFPRRPFTIVSGVPATAEGPVLGTARREKDGTMIFFIANVSTNDVSFVADFRATGVPVIWNPESFKGVSAAPGGGIAPAGYTRYRLSLEPQESVFVVFPSSDKVDLPSVRPCSTRSAEGGGGTLLEGPWNVLFPVHSGAPAGRISLPKLVSLSENADEGIRYFSGTATYWTTFVSPEAYRGAVLDLGDVRDIARVTLNGRDLGVAWHYPFRVDCGEAIHVGVNVLSIEVTNGWHNRLLGDSRLPNDCEMGPLRYHQCSLDGTQGICGKGIKFVPDWVWNADGSRPSSNRVTFTTWDYFSEGGSLVPSGLLGPVRVIDLLD